MSVRKVNLAEMFGRFQDQWKPKIVGEVNDSLVKLVKFRVSSSGIITTARTKCSWWSKVACGCSCGTAR